MATKKTPTPKHAQAKKAAPAPAPAKEKTDNVNKIGGVMLTMTAELGRSRDTIGKVMEYGDQSLTERDKSVGEPLDTLRDGELSARAPLVAGVENLAYGVTELGRQTDTSGRGVRSWPRYDTFARSTAPPRSNQSVQPH